jgi:hypothetical protein
MNVNYFSCVSLKALFIANLIIIIITWQRTIIANVAP